MKILAIKEQANESRVAITPDLIAKYQKLGISVYVQVNAGVLAGFSNEQYQQQGAVVVENINDILPQVEAVLSVSSAEIDFSLCKENTLFLSILNPFFRPELVAKLQHHQIRAIAFDLMPRITRAQSLDVLSSQSNLVGYQAVLEATNHLNKCLPMFMTAAGTVVAAKFMIIGAGVAGLQAIATAKRLGAIVCAFDVRNQVKEQVQSLGAKFIEVADDNKYDGVYATETSQQYQEKQQQLLLQHIKNQDVVITTALIPGKKAPILLNEQLVLAMKPNSVIIDLAVANGGNCVYSKINEVVVHNQVKIVGFANLINKCAYDASKLYSKNLLNFCELIVDKNKQQFYLDMQDEIIKTTLIPFKTN
ncbi:MAG: NAD(P) transhydrogenase subunit alpha [Proteobacteria bacterium]|jgi:NAD(P) transhydrogenase subunit alpha|nr:NAD(P) transhydrogenase subunit alpha [Pseudomonadota bacterium]